MYILLSILFGAVGLFLGYFLAYRKVSLYQAKTVKLEAQLSESKKSTELQLKLLKQNSEESLEALQGRFDETVAKMKAELENVTSEMLKRRQEEFADSTKTSMSQILEPLNMNLAEMRKAVNENTLRHSKLGGELSNNIQLVMQHSDAARQSAEKLSEALRRGTKVQGNWGERILTELLETHGLQEGIHFDTQSYITDEKGNFLISEETGRKLQPDVILHLDKNRDVIIDAKVSLTSYLDYLEAENEDKRELALKKHIESIEKHVKELAGKNYSSFIRAPRRSVNYVIMFIPNSGALHLATNNKTGLWRKAMEAGVYIADEQTLYAALRIIDLTWLQITQAENHEKVYRLADEMLTRVAAFMEKFVSVGIKLKDAQKNYEDAYSKLKDSGTSIPVTCQKLVKMGAKTKKIPKGVDPSLLGMGNDSIEDSYNFSAIED